MKTSSTSATSIRRRTAGGREAHRAGPAARSVQGAVRASARSVQGAVRASGRSVQGAVRASVRPVWAALLAVTLTACPPPAEGDPDAGVDGGPRCEWDDSIDSASALPLAPATAAEGWLCPVEDEDWYAFETGATDHLVRVRLAVDGPLSPVQPTYAIRTQAGAGQAGDVVASPAAAEVGGPLDLVHCMAPGPYYLVVRDLGNDAQDIRHPYTLEVTTEPDPDPAEPNDDASAAVRLDPGAPVQGTIACRGDTDWFALDVPAGGLLHLSLTAPVAAFEPTLRVVDETGQPVVELTNPAGTVRETTLERLTAVPTPGTWYVVVSDDDGAQADPETAYTLTVALIDDRDANEPNDRPAEATDLSAVTCSTDWSAWQTVTGTFGFPGDQDWLRLPMGGCARGLIEAEVELDTAGLSNEAAWALQAELQASLALVRPHADSPCTTHEACRQLSLPCSDGWDCAGYFNACLPEGLCSGASACLAEGVCGALMAQRRYRSAQTPSPVTGPPPANRAVLSAPLFAGQYAYLRLGDYQGDGADPEVTYTLRVRVRADPDPNEPSNVYTPDIQRADPKGVQTALAVSRNQIPVHDCVAGDCCDGTTWVTGGIGYDQDQDWYAYDHPCPGLDCMVRVAYEIDAGPTDLLFSVYEGSSLWYDGLAAVTEAPAQSATSGLFGGTGAADRCFYAWQGHTGSPFRYFISVRDLAEARDWDPDQGYRFCVEKIADGCSEPPCQLYDDGCGCREDDPNCRN